MTSIHRQQPINLSERGIGLRGLAPRLIAFILAIAILALRTDAALAQGAPQASIDGGVLEGTIEDGIQVFRGIPFAAAPVGDLRWRAPKPHPGWKGSRAATDFGFACPQAESRTLSDSDMDEDCLTLNIWTPARTESERLPVMVWIHGGGFRQGSSRLPIYDGRHLAKDGVVVVTFNYRVGLFGFFGHPDLTREAKAESSATGNFGLMDQIAALQWVKRHIGEFGGDAGNVTIFGESAGAISVIALMTSPAARGLFHKAIVQSGGGRWPMPSLDQDSNFANSAYARAKSLIDALGVSGPAPLPALRSRSWRELRDAQTGVPELTKVSLFLDGQIIPELFVPVFERGAQAQVPVLVGSTSFEGVPLRRELEVPTADVLAAAGDDLARLASLYPEGYTRTDKLLADAIWGDAFFVEPARKIAREASRGRQPVYHYLFDYRPPFLQRFLEGTPHGLDVLYVFGSFDSLLPPALLRLMKPENYAVSRTMRSYWTAFAKTGNPNGGRTLRWPGFNTTTNETMVFGLDGVRVERDYLKERLDLVAGRLN